MLFFYDKLNKTSNPKEARSKAFNKKKKGEHLFTCVRKVLSSRPVCIFPRLEGCKIKRPAMTTQYN